MRLTRRLVSVVASLASFTAGTASSEDISGESDRGRDPTPRIEVGGYVASGPSFYVWDEDPQQGRDWAAELRRSAAAGAGARGAQALEQSDA
jgi:hypothetical protein